MIDCLPVALARGSRETGQAITGAALSGVLLCEGRSKAVVVLFWNWHRSSFDRTQPRGPPTMSHDPPSAGPSQPADQSVARPNSYVVVARRYRPRTFDDLVGQQQMTQALINAINTNRVGHAYLFTGARGVGKTSTARIFAKALNCAERPDAEPGQRQRHLPGD